MPTLTNVGGGTNGTALTAGSSGNTVSGGNYFDIVTALSGHPAFATVSGIPSVTTGFDIVMPVNASVQECFGWSTSFTSTNITARVYDSLWCKMASLPTTTVAIARRRNVSQSVQNWRVSVTSAGKIIFADQTNTTLWTSTYMVTANTPFRVDIDSTCASTSGSSYAIRIYEAGSSTPIDSTTGSGSGVDLQGGTGVVLFGQGAATTSLTNYILGNVYSSTATARSAPVAAVNVLAEVGAGVAPDTIEASFLLSGGTNARIAACTDGLFSTGVVYSSSAAITARNIASRQRITGLTANTVYYVAVEVDGTLKSSTHVLQLKTWPTTGTQQNMKIVLGSCQQSDSNSVVFSQMKAVGADFFFHMGDLRYPSPDTGLGATQAAVITQYTNAFTNASNFQLLADFTNFSYAWDNHDWGGAQSDKSYANATVTDAAYREWWPNPTLSGTLASGGIYRIYQWGRIGIFQVDTRSQRDAYNAANSSSKTMLGTTQKAALKSFLSSTSYKLKIVVMDIMFSGQQGSTNDRWGSYPDEYTELANYIQSNKITNVVTTSGDRHAAGVINGFRWVTSGIYAQNQFPLLLSGAFDQGSEAGAESWDQYYAAGGGGSNQQSWGQIDVTDAGHTIYLRHRNFTSDGTLRTDRTWAFGANNRVSVYNGSAEVPADLIGAYIGGSVLPAAITQS